MKVALVCKKFSPRYGGLERYTIFLSRELVRAGHEVHVFAAHWLEEPGVVMHHVPMFPLSSPFKNLSFAYLSSRALSEMEFDVIHSMERILQQDIFRVSDGINPVQLQQRYPNPGVRWFKSKGPRRQVLKLLERRIFLGGGCKVVMANSNLVRQQIIGHYGVQPEKISVIYNPVDASRFHPGVKGEYRESVRKAHGISEEDVVLLFVANDFKLKGLRLLLQALGSKTVKDMKLIVIGKDNPNPYKAFAKKNHLGDQVLFLGPKRDLEMFYAASDVFVLPTRYDAFANVCLEAMATGLPVITTGENGAADLIRDGVTGFVLKSRDPEELARRIFDLASVETRRSMGNEAARTATVYSPERHMSEVLELYRRIVSSRER